MVELVGRGSFGAVYKVEHRVSRWPGLDADSPARNLVHWISTTRMQNRSLRMKYTLRSPMVVWQGACVSIGTQWMYFTRVLHPSG